MSFDSDAPTKKILLVPCSRSHDADMQCFCVCHRVGLITHLYPCCTPCPECGFKIENPPREPEYHEDEDPEA